MSVCEDETSNRKRAFELYGQGDYAGALACWKILAELGDAESQAWIGTLYENGQGVPLDDAEAFRWYLRSAEGGNRLAQNNVGAMYGLGRGVKQDYAEAAKWLARAADQGDVNAQFNLGVLCAKGKGVTQDMDRAVFWYTRAAEQGHTPSQARLGYLYSGNEGVKKDRVRAFVWLTLASTHGAGHALSVLESVVGQMSSDEKEEAQQRLAEYHSSRVVREIKGKLDKI